jgi:hypothetical protein
MFAILTPEQKEQLKQLREQHKKDMEKEKGPGGQDNGQSGQASAKKKPGIPAADDDDPFAGMTSDDDGPGGF